MVGMPEFYWGKPGVNPICETTGVVLTKSGRCALGSRSFHGDTSASLRGAFSLTIRRIDASNKGIVLARHFIAQRVAFLQVLTCDEARSRTTSMS